MTTIVLRFVGRRDAVKVERIQWAPEVFCTTRFGELFPRVYGFPPVASNEMC